jgi:hypothetical protein
VGVLVTVVVGGLRGFSLGLSGTQMKCLPQ